jgi:hypothetical protein
LSKYGNLGFYPILAAFRPLMKLTRDGKFDWMQLSQSAVDQCGVKALANLGDMRKGVAI